MRSQHQQLGFEDGLGPQREVHRHLVPVEVRVEGGTYQRVQADGLPFDQPRLESLYPQPVQGGGPVEEHRVAFQHILQDIPHHGLFLVDDLFGRLHGLDDAALNELADHKRLVQLGGHVFGQTALVQLHFRPDHDYRTGRIVDPFSEQVLAEAPLFSLEGIREGLQRPVRFGLHGRGLAGVVEEGIDRFLQHALFVAEDHLGRLDLHQALEPVVADDHPAVEVVQVRSGKTAPVKRHQRAQLGRDHGDHLHDHPLGQVLPVFHGLPEGFHHLQALEGLRLPLLGSFGMGLVAEVIGELFQVQAGEQVDQALGPHLGDELVRIAFFQVLVLRRQGFQDVQVFLFCEEVHLLQLLPVGALGDTRLNDHIPLVVDDHVELLGGKPQQVSDLVGQGTEVPDMSHGDHQVDVPHAVAAYLFLGHLHPAAVAHDAAVADPFVFPTGTFVILDGAEDALAEQSVPLGLVRAVVDGFRLQDFPP